MMSQYELREIRELLGFTDRQFARYLGISHRTIRKYVRGVTPIPRTIELYSRFMKETFYAVPEETLERIFNTI